MICPVCSRPAIAEGKDAVWCLVHGSVELVAVVPLPPIRSDAYEGKRGPKSGGQRI